MFTDMTGKKRLKMGLHTHTTLSDGVKTPEEVLEMYAGAGYDVLAITDHWKFNPAGTYEGMQILSGVEYDMQGDNGPGTLNQCFHVLGLGMTEDPGLPVEWRKKACQVPIYERVRMTVYRIREKGGIAILAHPAWSLNTAEQILEVCGFDGTEIYNSVSECGMSDRPYSGLIVDMLGAKGMFMPLLATDDVHYYNGDEMKGMIMVEADAVEELGILGAIKANRFYATQGPEIHFERISDTEVRVKCSPAVKVMFLSELPWTRNRAHRGKDITEAVYEIRVAQEEKYVRAEVTDANGLCAWSHVIVTGM